MFKLDQKGISLPIVLGAAALILANTYYFLAVNKKATDRNRQGIAQVADQSEEARITSFLSDINICANDSSKFSTAISGSNPAPTNELVKGNFYNKSIATLTSPSGITGALQKLARPAEGNSGVNFLAVGATYEKGTHKVVKYYIEEDKNVAYQTNTAAASRVNLKYNFVVEYELVTARAGAQTGLDSLRKKNSIIRIPLYMEVVGGLVKTCFVRPAMVPTENADIYSTGPTNPVVSVDLLDKVIGAACSFPANPPVAPTPGTDPTNPTNSRSNIATGNQIAKCLHLLTTPIADISNPTLAAKFAWSSFNGIRGLDGNQSFSMGYLNYAQSSPCAPGTNTTFARTITGNVMALCTVAYNGSCAGGSLLLKNPDNATIFCAPTSCTATQFMRNIDPTSHVANCYNRIVACGAGQYVKQIDSAGNVTCAPVVYKNVYCPAGQFATHIDPATPSNPLRCTSFSRYKDCGGDNRVFSNDFTTTGTACKGFWY